MKLNLENKTAICTGASRGIGKAIKEALESEGCKVTDLSRTSGYDLMGDLNKVKEIVKDTDILILNFGGGGTYKRTDYDLVMKKNYNVNVDLIHFYLQRKRDWGRIIMISSIFGKEKGPNPYFVAAKHAQIGLMKSMSQYYKNITFNTVCTGHILVGKEIIMKEGIKIGDPEDVANLVTFLSSDRAKHINGACVTCDGGESHSF